MTKNIKQWREEERPREKMLSKGCEALTTAELIAILIRSGSVSRTAVDTAGDILSLADNRLSNLSRLNVEQLCGVPGIGEAKALALMAAAELGRRIAAEQPSAQPPITCARSIAEIMVPQLKGLQHEECWALYLNRANRLIGKEKMSMGGVSSTVMDIRTILRRAVDKAASGIVLVHNHPSGNCTPGRTDIEQTAALREAAALLDISLIDHIVVAGNAYYSFSDGKNCYLRTNNNLKLSKHESNQSR